MFSADLGAVPVADAAFIEDVFSTWLYSGNGSTQTITNGTDLAGRGGLVWIKSRSAATDHALYDTARGPTFDHASSLTSGQTTQSTGLTSFLVNGFSIGSLAKVNTNAATYVSWTFREQRRFFDVVTWTGNGANRTIAHSLGSVPGCIMVKRTDASADWQVYHRSLAGTQYMVLNSTAAAATGANRWNSTAPTATEFSLGTDATVNANGGTYVAYLFAHDAGGFGVSGADNVISCGSYTGNGSATGPVVTLGYEPQWLLLKRTDAVGDWNLIDNMRGFVVGGADSELSPNLSNAESAATFVTPTSTGFQLNTTDAGHNASGGTYVYVTIRRGPMRTPTTGTSVFAPITKTGEAPTVTTTEIGFQQVDAWFNSPVGGTFGGNATYSNRITSRLTGFGVNNSRALVTSSTGVESSFAYSTINAAGTIYDVGSSWTATKFMWYFFRRAPGFFDVVCYTGTGANRTVNHNLGVALELMIVKPRSGAGGWQVYSATTGPGSVLLLNTNGGPVSDTTVWNNTAPTASVFSLGTSALSNASGTTYIAYLFGSCPGVSKVGSYTGTGATQTIDCGFTAGARFVLIKRTDVAGDWYVWDTARGIVAGNDPYLLLNSTAAEVTNTDWVDTAASGFELSNAAGNLVNVNGGSFIYLAIA